MSSYKSRNKLGESRLRLKRTFKNNPTPDIQAKRCDSCAVYLGFKKNMLSYNNRNNERLAICGNNIVRLITSVRLSTDMKPFSVKSSEFHPFPICIRINIRLAIHDKLSLDLPLTYIQAQ